MNYIILSIFNGERVICDCGYSISQEDVYLVDYEDTSDRSANALCHKCFKKVQAYESIDLLEGVLGQ